MSGLVTGWILKHSEAEGSERLVLVVLADHASSDGTDSYPGIETIRQEARLKSRRTVQNALRGLEERGEIIRVGDGPEGRTKYTVVMGGAYFAPPQSTTPGGRNLEQGGAQNTLARVEPSLEPSREPSIARDAGEKLFESPSSRTIIFDRWVQRSGRRQKLDDTMKRVIDHALEVRPLEDCLQAIEGLLADPWWRENRPTLELRYALKGNSAKGESDADRIDKMAAKAPRQGPSPLKLLLAERSPEARDVIYGKISDVERAATSPSEMNTRIGEEAEEWLRRVAKIAVVSRDGDRFEWGRA